MTHYGSYGGESNYSQGPVASGRRQYYANGEPQQSPRNGYTNGQQQQQSNRLTHTGTLGSDVSDKDASYYALHHLTALPNSVTKFADRTFSQNRIERALHSRMEQFTNRDSDRFRQLLRWIKNKQTIRPATRNGTPGGADTPLLEEGSGVSIIRREQFQNILEVLGVFATQDQADNLFNKYDTKGRGFLTLHELMCRASSALESDFAHGASELASGRNAGARSDEMFANKGKKQFLRQKLTGEGERPITPKQNSNLISIPGIVKALREKLRINAPVGDTQSIPRARREFARVFEYYDPQQLGTITMEQLVRALNHVNFPLGAQHQKLLLDAFPSATPPMLMKENTGSIYSVQTDQYNRPLQDPNARGFDYIAFIIYVFPDGSISANSINGNPLSTSLFLNHELGKEFFDNMSVEERRKRGLPPTHEQYEAMAREQNAAAAAAADQKGEEEKDGSQQQQQQHEFIQPPSARTLSQFARERAPPTPQTPSTPGQSYRDISGRAPPPSWNQTVERNPYLQTILANGAKHPGFPFTQSQGQAQILQLPQNNQPSQQQQQPGSQSARVYRELGTGNTLPPPPRTPGGSRYDTISAAGRQSSNALNPFSNTTSFIPNSAFLHPPRSANPVASPRTPATYGSGADAFTNILAAPSPQRRPTTGITTYVRGGSNKPLPPVTPRGGQRN